GSRAGAEIERRAAGGVSGARERAVRRPLSRLPKKAHLRRRLVGHSRHSSPPSIWTFLSSLRVFSRPARAITFTTIALALALAVSDAAPACPDCVSAGAARVALTVPAGTPLAGYGDRARRLAFPDVL